MISKTETYCAYLQISESDIVEFSSAIRNFKETRYLVQQSDDIGEKSVTEPCGPAPNAAEFLSRGQHGKQSMVRVGGVSDNIPSLGYAALGSNVLNGG